MDVWKITLRNHLPRVLVPLLDSYPDVALDLQEALNRVYDEGAFARSMDYQNEPISPLPSDDVAWTSSLLPHSQN